MDGIINVLKPPGLTSRQVVSMVKGITKEKKVGHGGTLDPGACGVLPVMLGRATKLFDYLSENEKEYISEFTLGVSTTTQDAYGEVINKLPVNANKQQFEKALSSFVGEYEQTPSAFSAVHIDGKRAYELAYAGKEVTLPKRMVNVYETELLEQTEKNAYLVRVKCSKGCYIRSLCEDVAKKLNTAGYVSVLIRTKLGRLNIENAVTLDELQDFKQEYVTPIDLFLSGYKEIVTPKKLDNALHNGNKLPVNEFNAVENNKLYKLKDSNNKLWAIGQKDGDIIRIKLMLRDK